MLDDPWIPCGPLGSQKTEKLSLMQVLATARDLQAIQHPSPIVTLVLHRFVVAFLYSALSGPGNVPALKAIIEAGGFDLGAIERYAQSVKPRFWLFHPERPFLQDPRLAEELRSDKSSPGPVFELLRESAPPARKTLFDHTVAEPAASLTPSEAACYLLADQFYALADGSGYRPSILTFGAAVLVVGANLFETLAFNLLPYNEEHPIKSLRLEKDRPFWEQDSLDPTPLPKGWLDYLTRPYRRLLLVQSAPSTVSRVYRKPATPLSREWRDQAVDPWVAYRITDKGVTPIGLRADRALWRDSHAVVQHVIGREQGAPGYVNLLAHLDRQAQVHVLGVVARNNEVDLWRHERLPLPRDYLIDPDLVVLLGAAIRATEDVRKVLSAQFAVLARQLLVPNWDELAESDQQKRWTELIKRAGGRKSRLDHLSETLNWERPYWAALDAPFRRLMVDFPAAWDRGEQATPLREWAEGIRLAASNAFEAAVRSIETSGRGLRAAARARGQFGARLNSTLISLAPTTKEVPA